MSTVEGRDPEAEHQRHRLGKNREAGRDPEGRAQDLLEATAAGRIVGREEVVPGRITFVR